MVPGEVCTISPERGKHRTRQQGGAERAEVSRGHSTLRKGRAESEGVLSMTEKGGND